MEWRLWNWINVIIVSSWLLFGLLLPHGPAALVELPIQFLSIKSITPST